MSFLPCPDPTSNINSPENIELVILPRASDIGNFEVRRALPFRTKRMVGPFIFWDQMGPGEFLTGEGLDVRPHPHIGLSTVTYLFQGTMDHKDSLGSDIRIAPGDVNVMTAGRGVVHSERTGQDIRKKSSTLFGIQSWLAQPKHTENSPASFRHTGKSSLPLIEEAGITGRVILGNFQGVSSQVTTDWDTLYVDLMLQQGSTLKITAETEERALYAIQGKLEISSTEFEPQQMIILKPGSEIILKAKTDLRLMLLGGAVMDGPRHIYWNFVSSSKDTIRKAKEDWQNRKFPIIPGDSEEFIPIP